MLYPSLTDRRKNLVICAEVNVLLIPPSCLVALYEAADVVCKRVLRFPSQLPRRFAGGCKEVAGAEGKSLTLLEADLSGVIVHNLGLLPKRLCHNPYNAIEADVSVRGDIVVLASCCCIAGYLPGNASI